MKVYGCAIILLILMSKSIVADEDGIYFSFDYIENNRISFFVEDLNKRDYLNRRLYSPEKDLDISK